ncbi:MAG: hypothetical protein ACI965_000759 [Paraglaciecola sp.]|jgi:hypothetical protein
MTEEQIAMYWGILADVNHMVRHVRPGPMYKRKE